MTDGVDGENGENGILERELPQGETCWTTALRCERRLKRRFSMAYAKRFGRDIVDELWSDVVLERATRVFQLFDIGKVKLAKTHRPILVNLDGYFIGSMVWYAWKWVKSRGAGLGGARSALTTHGGSACVFSLDAADERDGQHWNTQTAVDLEVYEEALTQADPRDQPGSDQRAVFSVADMREAIGGGCGLNGLDEFEVWLIHQVVVWERTYVDLSKVVDVAPQTVGRWYRAALAKIRGDKQDD